MKTYREDNDKSEGWAKRKYGVVSQIEEQIPFTINETQYQKLIAAEAVEDIWFIQESYFDTIKHYREIITCLLNFTLEKAKIDIGNPRNQWHGQ